MVAAACRSPASRCGTGRLRPASASRGAWGESSWSDRRLRPVRRAASRATGCAPYAWSRIPVSCARPSASGAGEYVEARRAVWWPVSNRAMPTHHAIFSSCSIHPARDGAGARTATAMKTPRWRRAATAGVAGGIDFLQKRHAGILCPVDMCRRYRIQPEIESPARWRTACRCVRRNDDGCACA